jgi:ABC-type Mn2+/Zn2+ transport system ATPase subunit
MGQRRRAVMAAAWVGEPKVVILDEPLEAMDRGVRQDILTWIDQLLSNGAAVVIATHQIEPFIDKVATAITVRHGSSLLINPLPADPSKRIELLESLTR